MGGDPARIKADLKQTFRSLLASLEPHSAPRTQPTAAEGSHKRSAVTDSAFPTPSDCRNFPGDATYSCRSDPTPCDRVAHPIPRCSTSHTGSPHIPYPRAAGPRARRSAALKSLEPIRQAVADRRPTRAHQNYTASPCTPLAVRSGRRTVSKRL